MATIIEEECARITKLIFQEEKMSRKVLLSILLATVGSNGLWASSLSGKLKHRLTDFHNNLKNQFPHANSSDANLKINFSTVHKTFDSCHGRQSKISQSSVIQKSGKLRSSSKSTKEAPDFFLSIRPKEKETLSAPSKNPVKPLNPVKRIKDSVNSSAIISSLSSYLLSAFNAQFSGLNGYIALNQLDNSSTSTLDNAISALLQQFKLGYSAVINTFSTSLLSSWNTQFTGLNGYTSLSIGPSDLPSSSLSNAILALKGNLESGFNNLSKAFNFVALNTTKKVLSPVWQFVYASPDLAGASLTGFDSTGTSLSYILGNTTRRTLSWVGRQSVITPRSLISFQDNSNNQLIIIFQYTGNPNLRYASPNGPLDVIFSQGAFSSSIPLGPSNLARLPELVILNLNRLLLSSFNTQFSGFSGYIPLNQLGTSSTGAFSGALSTLNSQFSSGCTAFSSSLTSSPSNTLAQVPTVFKNQLITNLSSSLLSPMNKNFSGFPGYNYLTSLPSELLAAIATLGYQFKAGMSGATQVLGPWIAATGWAFNQSLTFGSLKVYPPNGGFNALPGSTRGGVGNGFVFCGVTWNGSSTIPQALKDQPSRIGMQSRTSGLFIPRGSSSPTGWLITFNDRTSGVLWTFPNPFNIKTGQTITFTSLNGQNFNFQYIGNATLTDPNQLVSAGFAAAPTQYFNFLLPPSS